MRFCICVLGGLALTAGQAAWADEPRPVPLTRPEMKEYLEAMKARRPRIPLPALTAEEQAKLGERGSGYEARLRSLCLPGGEGQRGGFGFGRDADPQASLDYRFKTELFWIVSRANNCQYCLGHQESKLLSAGLTEDEIAALDGDWSEFPPAARAAFAFARKFTYEPHRLGPADIEQLRPFYRDSQILEMILSMAGNNAINRWKEGVGVPQSKNGGGFGRRGEKTEAAPAAEHSYLTPTSAAYRERVSRVAPLRLDPKTGRATRQTVCERRPLEAAAEVGQALEAARKRTPLLPLAPEAEARKLLPPDSAEVRVSQWVRLLANFPAQGKARLEAQRLAEEKGDLTPLLRAQVSWIIARQDRAWYAADEARRRLAGLGWSDEQIGQLDGDWKEFTPAERSLFTVARKLAASPVVLTDDDVTQALQQAGPLLVVQLIQYTTLRASFDRITEAAGLQLEP